MRRQRQGSVEHHRQHSIGRRRPLAGSDSTVQHALAETDPNLTMFTIVTMDAMRAVQISP